MRPKAERAIDSEAMRARGIIVLGTGHYLSPGGGRSIFVVTSEHLPDPPVEYLVF